jgi:hypothetical protein
VSTIEHLTNPGPADILAWAERNPDAEPAGPVNDLRAAAAEAKAAAVKLDRAEAELHAARQRLGIQHERHRVASIAVRNAADALKAQHALAVLPEVVSAMVADGWVDVTHAAVAVPSSSYRREVKKPPAADVFAALAQHKPGAKTASMQVLRASAYGILVDSLELRLDDFAIVGWPRSGCGLLNPEAARAALGILEAKAKKTRKGDR